MEDLKMCLKHAVLWSAVYIWLILGFEQAGNVLIWFYSVFSCLVILVRLVTDKEKFRDVSKRIRYLRAVVWLGRFSGIALSFVFAWQGHYVVATLTLFAMSLIWSSTSEPQEVES